MSQNPGSWGKFFKDAGIPPAIGAKYAVIFTDHRIQWDMVGDLTREILQDIGIEAMGDKLAILKQAKLASEQFARENTSKLLSSNKNERNSPKPASPAQRMINHGIASRDFSKGIPKEVSKLKTDKESGVFNRLGEQEETTEIRVFNRLGKQDNKHNELPYAGVLKSPGTPPKNKNIFSRSKPKAIGKSILDRLGPVVPDQEITTEKQIIKKFSAASTTSKRNLEKKEIVIRLGTKRNLPDSTAVRNGKVSKTVTNQNSKSTKLILKSKSLNVSKQKNVPVIVNNTPTTSALPVSRKTVTLKRKSAGDSMLGVTNKQTGKILTISKPKYQIKVKDQSISSLASDKEVPLIRKPISSNQVSSTSSAGIFRRTSTAGSSVFSRLGKT